jgi:hypothetical protein
MDTLCIFPSYKTLFSHLRVNNTAKAWILLVFFANDTVPT